MSFFDMSRAERKSRSVVRGTSEGEGAVRISQACSADRDCCGQECPRSGLWLRLRRTTPWLLCALLLLGTGSSQGGVVKIELPAETASFKPGPGADLANGQCLVCHSVEYVVTQPPLPRAFWTASLKKMREKFGARIPEDQVGPLIDYFCRNYGTETNVAPAVASAVSPGSTAPPGSGETVALKYGCLACHNVAVKVVGPAYKDIAAKYEKDSAAQAKIAEQIHKGGSGKWGPVLMPPFPMVSDAEVKVLTDWILSRR